MNNMRNYTLSLYPDTKEKLDELKSEKGMTWNELINYLMEADNEKTQNANITNDNRRSANSRS